MSVELSQPGGQSDMNEKRTGTASAKAGSDWKRVRTLTDRQVRRAIDTDPEVQPTDRNFWKSARVVMPRAKEPITIRLDADLLEWLRKQKGYQTRINAILRSYMQAHLTPERDT
jgi:uncharacterized protein (DUF4415 family)